MPITSTPQNPHNNTTPVLFTAANHADPFAIAQLVADRNEIPAEVLDQVETDCHELVRDSWLAFLDMFQMNIGFTTDFVQFLETTQPDYVIDDDGAVTRTGNDFAIDWSLVQGYNAGEDAFFYRVDDAILVIDDNGVKENGVITAIDKANNTFTAVTRNGAAWTVDTTNLTIDITGGDFDKGSCGPEGLLELRKKTSTVLNLVTIKDAMQSEGGKRYGFCLDESDGEYAWYDDNTMKLMKRLNKKVAKALMNEIDSVDGSAAYNAGKFGTKGLFQKLEEDGLVHTGYITDEAGLEAITTYWDSLGFRGNKEFVAHVDTTQYRYLEQIAGEMANRLNIELHVILGNTPDNMLKIGFNSLHKDGYTIHFSKWGLTEGNSPLGKKRIKDVMPKGIIMPMGTVPTKINGVERQVPYIFKAYQDFAQEGKPGMVRTYFTGGFAGGNGSDCEYLKITKSTTVGLGVVCPEAITLIK